MDNNKSGLPHGACLVIFLSLLQRLWHEVTLCHMAHSRFEVCSSLTNVLLILAAPRVVDILPHVPLRDGSAL